MLKPFLLLLVVVPIAWAQSSCSAIVDDLQYRTSSAIDQAPAIQACLNQAKDYTTLYLPPFHVAIKATLTIYDRTALTLDCQTSSWQGPAYDEPGFYWAGADGGTMLDTSGSGQITVKNCNFYSAQMVNPVGANGASSIILADTSPPSGPYVTTTAQTFSNLGVIGMTLNPNFVGFDFSPTGRNNVEHFTVNGKTAILCSQGGSPSMAVGIGIRNNLAGSSNAQFHLYMDNQFSNCGSAIMLKGGSASIMFNEFENNGIVILVGPGGTGFGVISGNNAEIESQFVNGGVDNMTIIENRIAACAPPSGHGCIDIRGGSREMQISGNQFDAGPYISINSTNSGPNLLAFGNQYSDIPFAGFGYVINEGGLGYLLLPTTCKGWAKGTVWNNAGTLGVCP